MKKYLSVLFGFIPLLCGWFLNYLMMISTGWFGVLWLLLSAALLFLWGYLALKTCHLDCSPLMHVIKMNAVGAIMLILVLLQELLLKQYWGSFLGFSTQFYFLPGLPLSMRILNLFSPVLPVTYTWMDDLLIFLMMLTSSLVGSYHKRRATEKTLLCRRSRLYE